ncbi:unknown transmembrane protein [Mesoplasma florum L1]|uniref:Uncharacterized protein n=1 Tax=Mesoplasma florum (strain ATCC 33453 / NBRC 100688 / NCTC 11704 / L1) TaxID=265311 RepID=Q6F130_MESFL|nr:hypothetical protein [Mesoplasma florum]AAT75793.1 unknown transmembrane protein [Mesoplasma florum L1]
MKKRWSFSWLNLFGLCVFWLFFIYDLIYLTFIAKTLFLSFNFVFLLIFILLLTWLISYILLIKRIKNNIKTYVVVILICSILLFIFKVHYLYEAIELFNKYDYQLSLLGYLNIFIGFIFFFTNSILAIVLIVKEKGITDYEKINQINNKNKLEVSVNNDILIAYYFLIASTIIYAILIIPLIWLIPMTLKTKRLAYNFEKRTGFGIWVLLFGGVFGLISGILLITNRIENYK